MAMNQESRTCVLDEFKKFLLNSFVNMDFDECLGTEQLIYTSILFTDLNIKIGPFAHLVHLF